MKWFYSSDYGSFALLPMLNLHELRCSDPDCQQLHGYMITAGWFFWAVGISFQTGGSQP